MLDEDELRQSTAAIVKSYVQHNRISIEALGEMIRSVSRALGEIEEGSGKVPDTPAEPAVPIRKSVSHDHITCLNCGRTFKSLRRHLTSEHRLTPDQYRARWSLPQDYPMVAPRYAAERSALARTLGLGLKASLADLKATKDDTDHQPALDRKTG